jgi:hypothetical protein
MDDPNMHAYGDHYKPDFEEELREIVVLMDSFFYSKDTVAMYAVYAPIWLNDLRDWFDRNRPVFLQENLTSPTIDQEKA